MISHWRKSQSSWETKITTACDDSLRSFQKVREELWHHWKPGASPPACSQIALRHGTRRLFSFLIPALLLEGKKWWQVFTAYLLIPSFFPTCYPDAWPSLLNGRSLNATTTWKAKRPYLSKIFYNSNNLKNLNLKVMFQLDFLNLKQKGKFSSDFHSLLILCLLKIRILLKTHINIWLAWIIASLSSDPMVLALHTQKVTLQEQGRMSVGNQEEALIKRHKLLRKQDASTSTRREQIHKLFDARITWVEQFAKPSPLTCSKGKD